MRFAFALLAALALAGCDDTVVVQLRTGPQTFDLDATQLEIPDALREGESPGTIARFACGPMGMCPSSDVVPLTCEDDVCDPAPRTVSAPLGDVVDIDAIAAEARELVRHVDAIEIIEASYELPSNTLSVELPESEIFWGPEGASDVDPAAGVVALGTVPAIPAGSTGGGLVALDPAGVAALSDYLVGTSRRVRFFARTRVDLEPGAPFPAGAARVAVDLRIEITGSIVQ